MSEIYTALAIFRKKISPVYLCGIKDSDLNDTYANIACFKDIATMSGGLPVDR